jgi:hypothetical protein
VAAVTKIYFSQYIIEIGNLIRREPKKAIGISRLEI